LPNWVARRAQLAQWIRENSPTDLPAEVVEEIAEAQADLERVYSVQETILQEMVASKVESTMPAGQPPAGSRLPEWRKKFDEAVDRLGKVARYERRARSRRNTALRRASS
jgi:hypothetical protein